MQKCTNRFFAMGMKMRRLIYIGLCLILVLGLTGCDEIASIVQGEKLLAVEYGTLSETASADYVSDGYTKVTYNSASDVVLAVENMKASYGILDEFQLNSFIDAERNIKKSEECDYSMAYCAYFDSENSALQKEFNEAIEELKNNGTIDEIKNAHLKGEEYKRNKAKNENGTLTMLCDPHFDNRVYRNSNDEIVGLDVDIAYEICNYLGYDLEISATDFDELFVDLSEGEGDFVVSACEVDEERAEYYLLSDSYFTLNFYLIERN